MSSRVLDHGRLYSSRAIGTPKRQLLRTPVPGGCSPCRGERLPTRGHQRCTTASMGHRGSKLPWRGRSASAQPRCGDRGGGCCPRADQLSSAPGKKQRSTDPAHICWERATLQSPDKGWPGFRPARRAPARSGFPTEGEAAKERTDRQTDRLVASLSTPPFPQLPSSPCQLCCSCSCSWQPTQLHLSLKKPTNPKSPTKSESSCRHNTVPTSSKL